VEFENFNAASATFTVNGVSVHPGSAKGSMINASLVAMEINGALPAADIPALTEGYEGFYHLTDMSGDCSKATLAYIVRDHDAGLFEARLNTLRHIEKVFREKYGEDKISLVIKEQYRNMKEQIEPCMHLIENAFSAIKSTGLTPGACPIRGGTDGARLSFMGLPCPNLGTGGYSFHGPLEHISVQSMDTAVKIILNIIELYSK
jgi:tripeptide aminopeptidase